MANQLRRDELQFLLTVDMKKYREDMKGAVKEINEVNKGFDGLVEGSKAYIAQTNKLREATKKFVETANFNDIAKQKRALEGELKKLVKGTAEYTRTSEQLKTVAERYKELKQDINGTTQAANAAKQGMSNIGTAIKGAFAGIASLFAVEKLIEFAQYLRDIIDQFMQYRIAVTQTLDTVGEETNTAVANLVGISRTFGAEFEQTLVAANALSKEFGISAKEATDLISSGFLAGANVTGEFLDILKEYPAQFREAGVSAERSIAIITQSIKDGVFSDKGADAIKEATIKLQAFDQSAIDALKSLGINTSTVIKGLGDGNLKAIDVIDQVSAKIGELPENSAVARQAIAGIFGSPGEDAGRAFIESIAKTQTGIDGLIDSSNQYSKAQRERLANEIRLADAQNTVSLQLEQQNSSFNNFMVNMKASFFEALASSIEFFAYFNSNVAIMKVKFYEFVNSISDEINRVQNMIALGPLSWVLPPLTFVEKITIDTSSAELQRKLDAEKAEEYRKLELQRDKELASKRRQLTDEQSKALTDKAKEVANEVEKAAKGSVDAIEQMISDIKGKLSATDDLSLQIKLNVQLNELDTQLNAAKEQLALAEELASGIKRTNLDQLEPRQTILIDTDAAAREIAALNRVAEINKRFDEAALDRQAKLKASQEKRITDLQKEGETLGQLGVAAQNLGQAFGESTTAGIALTKISQGLAIAQSIAAVQAAVLAVSQAATVPFPGNLAAIISLVSAIATGVTNVKNFFAVNNKFGQGGQLPEAGKGGMTVGAPHRDGGIALIDRKSGQELGEVEGGEVILSRAFADNNPQLTQQLLRASRFGGKLFALGGLLPSPTLPTTIINNNNQDALLGDIGSFVTELGTTIANNIVANFGKIKVELPVSDISNALERRNAIRNKARVK